jgi:hypothetical protein
MNANGSARAVPERHRWLRAVETRIDGQVVEVPAGMHGLVDRLRVGQPASVRAGGRFFAARVAGLSGREEPALLEFIARPVVALRPGTIAAAAVDGLSTLEAACG